MNTSPRRLAQADLGTRGSARRGFTLIDLLIVIVVLGILTGIAIASFGPSQGAVLLQSVKEDVQHLAAGAQAYYPTHSNSYASATVALLGVTMSPENTASTITVKAFNGALSQNCAVTLGNPTSGPTCATGP